MKEFVQETVTKRYAQLPEEVQRVILSDELANSLRDAMLEAKLDTIQTTQCNQQTTLVIVGLSTTKEFREFIFNELSLSEEKALTLFDTISTSVFAPVRDTLLKAFDKNTQPEQTNTPPADPYREQVA